VFGKPGNIPEYIQTPNGTTFMWLNSTMYTLLSIIVGIVGLGVTFLADLFLSVTSVGTVNGGTSQAQTTTILSNSLLGSMLSWGWIIIPICILISLLAFFFLKKVPYIGQASNTIIVVWTVVAVIWCAFYIIKLFI
jgi:hypothetical protein